MAAMAETPFEVVVIAPRNSMGSLGGNGKVFVDKVAPVAGRYVVVLQSNCGRCRSAGNPHALVVNDGADVLTRRAPSHGLASTRGRMERDAGLARHRDVR
jgi:hypothetical protein